MLITYVSEFTCYWCYYNIIILSLYLFLSFYISSVYQLIVILALSNFLFLCFKSSSTIRNSFPFPPLLLFLPFSYFLTDRERQTPRYLRTHDLRIAYLSQQQLRSFNLPYQLGFSNIPEHKGAFESPLDADTGRYALSHYYITTCLEMFRVSEYFNMSFIILYSNTTWHHSKCHYLTLNSPPL